MHKEKREDGKRKKKNPLMSEEQFIRFHGAMIALMDIKERQKICEAELSRLLRELCPIEKSVKLAKPHFP